MQDMCLQYYNEHKELRYLTLHTFIACFQVIHQTSSTRLLSLKLSVKGQYDFALILAGASSVQYIKDIHGAAEDVRIVFPQQLFAFLL